MVGLCTMIAGRQYHEIERLTGGNRLSAQDISDRIKEYGRTVIVPPPEAVKLIDFVLVAGSVPKRWSVQIPLWTVEEGRSDLTLAVTLIENGERLGVEIDDLHVL